MTAMYKRETHKHDPLDFVDGCMDGTTCPDAGRCREDAPESCPLLDDQFELDPELPLDSIIECAYFSTVGEMTHGNR